MSIQLPPDGMLQADTRVFLARSPHKLLIGGEWVEAASKETYGSGHFPSPLT